MTFRDQLSSSCLSDVGYDYQAKTLVLEFHHGGVYRYDGVPPFIYEGLLRAPSVGKYFQRHIRSEYVGERMS